MSQMPTFPDGLARLFGATSKREGGFGSGDDVYRCASPTDV